MPAFHSLHVAFTAEFREHVAKIVASGRYQSASEVVRTTLRTLERGEGEPTVLRQDNRSNYRTDGSDAPPR